MGMILKGDCIEVMKAMKPNSVDAIVCDPPYGLEFMGKEWDKLWTERPEKIRRRQQGHNDYCDSPKPCYKAGLDGQLWHTQWLTEAYRVLKPGGSMLVMGGTRTSHRLACAIEDSGFIIKDTLMWVYGSGFPKAQDLGKMIDKRYKKKPEYYELAEFIKKGRLDLGKSINDVAILFPSKTGGITGCVWNWENAENVPTIKQWQILKKQLRLSNKFNWLIEQETKRWEEAKREKIGHKQKSSHGKGSSYEWAKSGDSINNGLITASTTDLAKYWDGFKVGGIKPAYEPIIWAVKPPEGSYVDNVLKHGVGAVNVDECRVGLDGMEIHKTPAKSGLGKKGIYGKSTIEELMGKDLVRYTSKGRFPANVILSHHPECMQVGVKRVSVDKRQFQIGSEEKVKTGLHGIYGKYGKKIITGGLADPDGLETVESWDCHPDCAVRMLDEQSGDRSSTRSNGNPNDPIHRELPDQLMSWGGIRKTHDFRDNGGASRFFYCAKASRGERNAGLDDLMISGQRQAGEKERAKGYGGDEFGMNANQFRPDGSERKTVKMKNNHPTVKPIKLFEWLIKLVTREGQIILDPFIGSGTTAIAAHNTGRKCVGIEKEDEYLTIAKRRIDYWKNQPKQMEMGL